MTTMKKKIKEQDIETLFSNLVCEDSLNILKEVFREQACKTKIETEQVISFYDLEIEFLRSLPSEKIKRLKKCQDCGNEISPTALFCPHCGCIPNESIITNGYHAGDKVQVNYNINKILGEIVSISPIFLKIKRRNNGIITVRQSSIDSIQILEEDTSDNIELSPINTKSPISTVQIVDSFDALLSNIFDACIEICLSIYFVSLVTNVENVIGIYKNWNYFEVFFIVLFPFFF